MVEYCDPEPQLPLKKMHTFAGFMTLVNTHHSPFRQVTDVVQSFRYRCSAELLAHSMAEGYLNVSANFANNIRVPKAVQIIILYLQPAEQCDSEPSGQRV